MGVVSTLRRCEKNHEIFFYRADKLFCEIRTSKNFSHFYCVFRGVDRNLEKEGQKNEIARAKIFSTGNHAHYYKTALVPGGPYQSLQRLIDEREQNQRSERLYYQPLYDIFQV